MSINAEDIFSGKELFMDRFMSNVSKDPERTAIIDAESGKAITYKELDTLSGKVYRVLCEAGIGKESVVMIALPRGIDPFIASIGVWKAGAAVLLLENNNYLEKNKEYIYKDCHCKLLIDTEIFRAMMEAETKEGFNAIGLHDLAYIVYTSGTTGHPKGVMHEYGTMNLCVFSLYLNGKPLLKENDFCALITPLNFIATQIESQLVFYHGSTLVVPALSTVKNPSLFAEKCRKYHINKTFVTPSFFHIISEAYPFFEAIFMSAEPIKNLYAENTQIIAIYSQSESGYASTLLLLKQAYDVAPLGKNPLDEKLTFVVNERGEVLHGEGEGELCYWNPFFRGYVGLDELTKSVSDGAIVHSGDIVKQTSDGTLYYQCRKDDMVKINGNRVEPSEIEAELQRVLGVEWTAVRAFAENDKSLLCAYYIGEPKISIDDAKELLRKNLASYMVPAVFMQIDKIPFNANGKFSRILLPKPLIEQPEKKYVAPSTKTEKAICDAMATVLGMKTFGASNDFYEMGGDSLRSIRLIQELGWDKLEAAMIFQGRTPERIARIYEKAIASEPISDADIQNKKALRKEYPLMMEQQYMFDYQQHTPESTTWNLSFLLSFQKEYDIVRVQRAVLEAMKKHPIFSVVYCFNENRELVQRYEPENTPRLGIERTTEAEFAKTVKTLVQPIELLNSPLYRIQLFETEQKGYLFLDLHHSIVDGNSLHIFIDDIQRAYAGMPLEEDFYFLNLEERLAQIASPLYEEGRAYYARTLDRYTWECYPTLDEDSDDYQYGCVESFIPIAQQKYDAIYKEYGLSKNAFFIAVTLLAIGSYNHKSNIKISWVFHGREKVIEQHIVGTLLKEFYVGVHIKKQMSLKEFFDEILQQIRMSMKYSCYPYPGLERMDKEGEDASLIYQYDLLRFISKGELQFTMEDLPLSKSVADNLLDIEIRETDGGCNLFMEYNGARYKEESMHRFRDIMIHTACLLMEKMGNPQCTLNEILEE